MPIWEFIPQALKKPGKRRNTAAKFFRNFAGKMGISSKSWFQTPRHMQLAQIFQIGIARMNVQCISRAKYGEIWEKAAKRPVAALPEADAGEFLKNLLKKQGFFKVNRIRMRIVPVEAVGRRPRPNRKPVDKNPRCRLE